MPRRREQLGETLRRHEPRIAQLDRQQVGDRREEGQHHRRRMPRRRGLEGLHGDVHRHEHDDRRQHRQRQQFHQTRDQAEHAAQADEQARQQGIAAARAHALVGGLADVGRGLGDAAAQARDQGGHRFGEQDVAGAVVVAGGARAFGHVDATDDHQQAEGQRQRRHRQHQRVAALARAVQRIGGADLAHALRFACLPAARGASAAASTGPARSR